MELAKQASQIRKTLVERAASYTVEGADEVEENRLKALQLKFKIHRRWHKPNFTEKLKHFSSEFDEGLVPSRKKPFSRRQLTGASI